MDNDELARAFEGCRDDEWREFIENWAYGGKLHHQQPKIKGQPPPGAFRLSRDVFAALGPAVARAMFAIDDDDDPSIVHPHVVRILGEGSLAAGRRVLEKFVAMLRRQSRDGDGVVLEHDGLDHADDGHHGWRVAR
jgi:hypothetical protein